MLNTNILLRHDYIPVPSVRAEKKASITHIATLVMNLSYYGCSLDEAAVRALQSLSNDELSAWWEEIKSEIKKICGANRKMGDFVVYKNFPREVFEKSEAEYWFAQILMYWGFPNGLFTEAVEPRAKMKEQPKLKVLRLAGPNSLQDILNSYVAATARWKKQEFSDVVCLSSDLEVKFEKFGFKENLVSLATKFIESGKMVKMKTATDVLRLAAGLSLGDVSLREKVKFISFNRKTRKYFLALLQECRNLSEDVARRPEMWKRFLHNLHPQEFKMYANVRQIADLLYKDKLVTFNSSVEKALAAEDDSALTLLQSRPGEFRRRLVHCLSIFGDKAVENFGNIVGKLTVAQLVSLRSVITTMRSRKFRTFPPKGNWAKLQIGSARKLPKNIVGKVSQVIGEELSKRVPKVGTLEETTQYIKLPSNDGDTGKYTRGTVFPIPECVDFIRTASYWECKDYCNTWFDNGWNLFDKDWQAVDTCCWNHPKACEVISNGELDADYEDSYEHRLSRRSRIARSKKEYGAMFSGDPTNSKDAQGRACQLIDLNLAALKAAGVRYAVWNVLCFSHIPFSDAKDVFAALQWGADAQSGELFEPSRCQLAFPLTGKYLTKFVCYIDLKARELTYMDVNFKGAVNSAMSNAGTLQQMMPAYVEYLNSLPSVFDLFCESVSRDEKDNYVLYSDADVELKDVSAYVFRKENEHNSYKEIDLNAILSK